jgi:hypothetical protein
VFDLPLDQLTKARSQIGRRDEQVLVLAAA